VEVAGRYPFPKADTHLSEKCVAPEQFSRDMLFTEGGLAFKPRSKDFQMDLVDPGSQLSSKTTQDLAAPGYQINTNWSSSEATKQTVFRTRIYDGDKVLFAGRPD